MSKLDRLIKYINYKGLSLAKVCRMSNISSGLISKSRRNNGDISENVCYKICKIYQDLNLKWLLYGEGSMLYSSNDSAMQDSDYDDLIDCSTTNDDSKSTIDRLLCELTEERKIIAELVSQNSILIKMLNEKSCKE